ncbi:MAG: 30S ribosomal protein S16 [bacterium]|nr:30S ribosomal protein S16 [bacterium]
MLKIRLRRMGSRHRPHYRVVVSDSRRAPTAASIEEIGYYDPRKKPSVVKIDVERARFWQDRGAQLSETVKQLVAKAMAPPAEETAAETAIATDAAAETAIATDAAAETATAEAAAAEAAAAETATAEAAAAEETPAETATAEASAA